MRQNYYQYREAFSDDLNIQHKVTPATEKSTFHLHSHLELLYAVSDNLVLFTEKQAKHLPAGTLVLLNSLSLHYFDYLPTRPVCDRYVLYFTPEMLLHLNTPEINLLDCFLRHQGDCLILPLAEKDREPVVRSLEEMIRCASQYNYSFSSKNAGSTQQSLDLLSLQLEIGKLLIHINKILLSEQRIPDSFSYQAHSQDVTQICQYIDRHYEEALSVESISRQFLISKTQLYNIFKEVLCMSVSDYISQVRITQAKSKLINTDYSVEIISQQVGYSNISSFSRVFKAKTGMGPLQYRKRQEHLLNT